LCPDCGQRVPIQDGIPLLAPDIVEDGKGFREELFADLAEAEATNFWFRARNRLITWVIGKHFPKMERFLEIGCGTGYVLSAVTSVFPATRVTGSEIFPAGLAFAARKVPDAELLQMDARAIPYREEFDVVGAFDVLEHIQEDETVLAEIRSALVPRGGIVLSVPQHRWLWSDTDVRACHARRYGAGELAEKVSRAGFEILYQTSFVSLLLPAMYVSRYTKRNGKLTNELAELRLPTLVNDTLEAVMTVERRLLRLGVSMPIGGSRLLVARRAGA
jgi:SAM-dependent methyltransferase